MSYTVFLYSGNYIHTSELTILLKIADGIIIDHRGNFISSLLIYEPMFAFVSLGRILKVAVYIISKDYEIRKYKEKFI